MTQVQPLLLPIMRLEQTRTWPGPRVASASRSISTAADQEEDLYGQMVEELERVMDRAADEPELMESLVTLREQVWDLDELVKLKELKKRQRQLCSILGPTYKRPPERKQKLSLRDHLFTPLGLKDLEMVRIVSETSDLQGSPSASSSSARHAKPLRDGFALSRQLLTDMSFFHLVVFCEPEEENGHSHLETLLEAAADVNTPATFPAVYAEERTPGTDSSSVAPDDQSVVSIQAIHIAVSNSSVQVVRRLLQAKASPDARATFDTIPDFTALHLAGAVAKARHDEAWHESRASDSRRSSQAHSRSDSAHEVIRLLLEAGADVRAVDLSCESSLRHYFEFNSQETDKWTAGMDEVNKHRVTNLLKAGVILGVETESAMFRGLTVRLPDPGELTEEEKLYLANASTKERDGVAGRLTVAELRYLFRKDFKVCNVLRNPEGEAVIECKLLPGSSSGTRTRTHAESALYHFPRYMATDKPGPCWSQPRSFEGSSHSSPVRNPMAAMRSGRKAWRRLGVLAQGYQHFQMLLSDLRSAQEDTERGPGHMQRYLTSPVLRAPSSEDEDGEDMPPRPSTTTGVLSKARTAAEIDIDDAADSEGVSHLDVVLDMPLPPGSRYKKSWIFRKGCLLHYVTHLAARGEDEKPTGADLTARQQAWDDLQLVLNARVDVQARAFYRGRGGAWCTTTALHMVAASSACVPAVMLLRARASIEGTSTMNGLPYYHALHNAAYFGSERLCKLLLKRRACANSTNNEGRSSLHLAVKQNHIEVVRLLVEGKADVVMRDRRIRSSGRTTMGLTPLDMCRRATRQYKEAERKQVMALLAPSFNGINSFLFDLYNMAKTSDSEISNFLVDQALKTKTPEVIKAMAQLKAAAVNEEAGEELCPVEYLAAIIERAPRVGVRVLMAILLDDPDMEDTVRGALPPRANLKPRHQDSWLPWRRHGWFVAPFLCGYQRDANSRRKDKEMLPAGRENWPCWLHSEDEPDPSWHRDVAPPPGNLGYRAGDSDVQVKVLLLANAIDVRILRAFSRVLTLDVFAELIVQAIIGCTFDQVASAVITLLAFEEAILFMLFMKWSKVDCHHWWIGRFCWCVTTSIALKEVVVSTWAFARHTWTMGWPWHQFFFTNSWSHGFKATRIVLLLLLVFNTHTNYCLDLMNDETGEEDTNSYPRKLLGTNIVVQGLQIVLLLRNASAEAEFGRHILSIIHSFGRLWAILVVMVCFFFSFSFAFFVIDEKHSWLQLMEKVYRGLLLGDGDGLDFMEGRFSTSHEGPHRIEWFLSCFATFLFTICLLNISIAVFQTEYENALKESYLHFWQHRAFLCMSTLLGPRWPWGSSDLNPFCRSVLQCVKRVWPWFVGLFHQLYSWLRGFHEPELLRCNHDEREESARCVLGAGIIICGTSSTVALALFLVSPVHAIFSASCLGVSLCILQALCVRNEALSARKRNEKYFLWICFRADFSPSFFMEKDVEKNDIVDLREKLDDGVAELIRGISAISSLDIGGRLEKLEASVQELERRLPPEAGAGIPASAAAVAAAEVQKAEEAVKATVGGTPMANTDEDTIEWAAAFLPRGT